jgi:hypothetical protein
MKMLKYKDFVNEFVNIRTETGLVTEKEDVLYHDTQKLFNLIKPNVKEKLIELGLNYIKSVGIGTEVITSTNPANVLTISNTVTKLRIDAKSRKELTFGIFIPKLGNVISDLVEKFNSNKLKDFNRPSQECGVCVMLLCLSLNSEFVQYGTKNQLSVEDFQISEINRKIREAASKGGVLRIKIDGEFINSNKGPYIVEAVSAKKSISKSGKADVDFLVDIDGKSNKNIYLSLKDRKSNDAPGQGFQQYAGLKGKFNYPFIQAFASLLKEKLDRNHLVPAVETPRQSSFAVPIPIESMEIVLKSIFGLEATEGNQTFSSENLHMLVEGELTFEEDEEGFYSMSPGKNSEIIYNPAISNHSKDWQLKPDSPYWPCVFVKYSKDESQGKTLKWNNARFGIWASNNRSVIRAIKYAEDLGITKEAVNSHISKI